MHTAEVFKYRKKKVVQKSVCVINYNISMDIVDNECFSFRDISRHKHHSIFFDIQVTKIERYLSKHLRLI